MILDKEVEVILYSHNINYYEIKGYDIPRKKNKYNIITVPRKSKIKVKIKDLQKSSNVLVDWQCEECGKIEKRSFNNCRKLCKSCSSKGELSRSWNGGTSKPVCLECGKRISFGSSNCKPCRAKKIIGRNNPNYNPNLSRDERILKRKEEGYSVWRNNVKYRDKYTCQKCNYVGYKNDGVMVAHHMSSYRYNKNERINESNGITLCKECHLEFHKCFGFRNNTFEQNIKFIEG